MAYKNIFTAIYAKDIGAIKTFLPAQLNSRDNYGCTPLLFACYWGNIETVKLLLDSGADIEARDNDGNTVLHNICVWCSVKTVCLLLDRGADINARDKEGCTPLHKSCINGYTKISEFLVSRGADPFVKNRYEKSPLNCDKEKVIVKDENGNEVPHSQILIHLRNKYLMNQHALEESERTAALSSGWEMEM